MDYEVFASQLSMADEWRVEAIDESSEGEVYVAIFSGPRAKERAEEYAEWKRATERLTRERDEARAQLDRVRKLVEKWRAEVVEYPPVSSWGAVLMCADELDAILSGGQ